MSRTPIALACALLLTACSGTAPSPEAGDIGKVVDLKADFGPEFTVSTQAPTGVDPRLLAPQALPQGIRFDPADCGDLAKGLQLPQGLKGNMAAVTAEGAGNRFITIAVETSEPVSFPEPGANCQKVAFEGPTGRGLVEVTEAPSIEAARVLGTHRVVQTVADGKPVSGELYDYVAAFGTYLVIVTANPLVVPGRPVAAVDTGRARDLVVAAVHAVRGS